MSIDAHLNIIRAAVDSNKQLERLTHRSIGTSEHPRGRLLTAFRKARSELMGNVGKPIATSIAREYSSMIVSIARDAASEAARIGQMLAIENANAISINPAMAADVNGIVSRSVSRVELMVNSQTAVITSGMLSEEQLLGEGDQLGLFTPSVIQRELMNELSTIASLITMLDLIGLLPSVIDQLSGIGKSPFLKQAVAVISSKTTPCCLGVHGQAVELNAQFLTSDKPAFARAQYRPPFHWNCRTSQVLVLREMAEDDLTTIMKKAADLERTLRGALDYVEPPYVNAFTRFKK